MTLQYINPKETDKILFVNIKKSYMCTDSNSNYFRPSTYEATRKYWRLSEKKLHLINLVIGHVGGIVKEVIVPEAWSKNPEHQNRYECTGREISDSPYLGMCILNIVQLGQNPVNYYNL